MGYSNLILSVPYFNSTNGEMSGIKYSELYKMNYAVKNSFYVRAVKVYNGDWGVTHRFSGTITIQGVTYTLTSTDIPAGVTRTVYTTGTQGKFTPPNITGTATITKQSTNMLSVQEILFGADCTHDLTNATLNSINFSTLNLNDTITISASSNMFFNNLSLYVFKSDGEKLELSPSADSGKFASTVTIPPKLLKGDFIKPFKFYAYLNVSDTVDGKVADGTYKLFNSVQTSINGEDILPTVGNLTLHNNLDSGIRVTWSQSLQSRYELTLMQGVTTIFNQTLNSTSTSVDIPFDRLIDLSAITVKLKTVFIPSGYEQNSEYWTYSTEYTTTATPYYNPPSITNLNIIGDYYEKPITVNWRSEYQTGYEYECYYNNVKVKNGTGATAQTFTIPANTFTGTLPASVRVRVIRSINGQTLYSGWQERNITLKEITPTISNVSLSGSNVDLPITVSWESTDQQGYELKVEKDDSIIKTYTGTTSTNVTIPASTLTTGLYKFSARVSYNGRWSDWKLTTATLIETLPSIGAFEPDGVIVERDDIIRIWWTSTNQSKWTLRIDDTLTYSGTGAKEHLLLPATLQTGNHSMTLTVTYVTSSNIEKHVSKKTEFIVQGKPPIPTITSSNTFTSNRPIITWDTQDQQGYILDVLKDNIVIYTTDWQNGLITEHKVMEYLENGVYTIRVKVMNQYTLESDYGSTQITINAIESTDITLNSRIIDKGIYLWWDNNDYKFETFYLIRNGDVIAKIDDTIYYDYTAHNDCEYVIRGITSSDVYKDSNKVNSICNIENGMMATIDKIDDIITVGLSNDEFNLSGTVGLEVEYIQLSGREHSVVIFGEHTNSSYTINFNRKDLFRFLNMFKRRQIFCYRDSREKVYLSIDSTKYKPGHFGMDYSIDAIQVDYKEGVEYD